jgi:hypothetical protein
MICRPSQMPLVRGQFWAEFWSWAVLVALTAILVASLIAAMTILSN